MSTDIKVTAAEMNCTPEQYHADTSKVGHSMLDDFRANPAYYHGRYVAETIAATEPTESMALGTLVHTLVLSPETWCNHAVAPAVDGRTKEGKALKAAFDEQNAGKIIVPRERYSLALRIAGAVFKHDEASQILALESPWPNEHAIWWTDEETGLLCKSLRDKPTQGILADLKTCRDASPRGFAKAADDFGYARQGAWYLDGHEAFCGELAEFYFIAVETSEPFSVAIHRLDDDWSEFARKENRAALGDLAIRFRSGDWLPAFSHGYNTLRMPRYAAYRSEYE